MRRYFLALYLAFCLLCWWPAVALAHEEHGVTGHYINPPDWLGWLMTALALVIPMLIAIRIRGGR